jgi:hypothetical protein
MLAGLIVAYPQPAEMSCWVLGGSTAAAPGVRGAPKEGVRAFSGLYPGYWVKMPANVGSFFTSKALSAALIRSISSGGGWVGLGRPVLPNIMRSGTGPFAFAGTTTVMAMLTWMAG